MLVIPKYLGVTNYGYWQLYVFYSTYTSYLSLGLTDGLFISVAGLNYDELEKNTIRMQFYFLIVMYLFISTFIVIFIEFTQQNMNKTIVLYYSLLSGLILVPRSLLTFVLQGTSRVKEYSFILILDRISYFIISIILIIAGVVDYDAYIKADIFGKGVSFIFSLYILKDLVIGKLLIGYEVLKDIYININVGIKVLAANLSSILIIGTSRYYIQNYWSIETFGEVSLTFSLSNIITTFINAISVVLFPKINRWSIEEKKDKYLKIRKKVSFSLIAILPFFYILKYFVIFFLPQYYGSIKYLSVLFPLILFDGKVILLLNNYLKSLREEKYILKVNFLAVVLNVLTSFLIIKLSKNLFFLLSLLIILLFFRSLLLELKINKILKTSTKDYIIFEILFISIFFIISTYVDSLYGLIIYYALFFITISRISGNRKRGKSH